MKTPLPGTGGHPNMALSIMGETARVVSWTVGLDGDHWSHYGKTASLILNEGGLGSHVKFLLVKNTQGKGLVTCRSYADTPARAFLQRVSRECVRACTAVFSIGIHYRPPVTSSRWSASALLRYGASFYEAKPHPCLG